nr:LysM peptidoglycan-binding domain-containing protein [Bifidobacterium miconisargentati]
MRVTSYIVRPGDTLWLYASRITPAGQDVSQTVDRLMALNGLESSSLRAGQRIIVPAE